CVLLRRHADRRLLSRKKVVYIWPTVPPFGRDVTFHPVFMGSTVTFHTRLLSVVPLVFCALMLLIVVVQPPDPAYSQIEPASPHGPGGGQAGKRTPSATMTTTRTFAPTSTPTLPSTLGPTITTTPTPALWPVANGGNGHTYLPV